MAPHGRCYCGAIEWTITGKIDTTGNCHCTDCQRISGSAYGLTSFLVSGAEGVEFKGTPKIIQGKSDAGKSTQRGFCGDCGSALFNHVGEGEPDEHWGIRTGGIIGESPKMQVEIFMKSKPEWVPSAVPEVARFEAMPK